MSWDRLLQLSHEARAWFHLFSPYLSAIAAWHLPQPKYMKRTPPSREEG